VAKQSLKYRDEDRSLDLYLREIGETPLITADEEVRLAKRIKQGDKRALEKLTKANLRFVVSVAKQYQNQGLSLADLINEGNIGLIKAAKRFDETAGSSSSATRSGGSARRFCRHWPSRAELSVCP